LTSEAQSPATLVGQSKYHGFLSCFRCHFISLCRLLLSCTKWKAEFQRCHSESTDITDVFQDYTNLLELLISPDESAYLYWHWLMGYS